MYIDLTWSLKEKIIHWDSDYQHCKFPRESDAVYQAPSFASSTSNCIHCGKSLQQYLNEDIIHHEYISATEHFAYQECHRLFHARTLSCPWPCCYEHCVQMKNILLADNFKSSIRKNSDLLRGRTVEVVTIFGNSQSEH